MIPVYNLKAYTEKESGFTPTSFALAQIVEASASLIDEYIEHNDMSELSAIEKVYLNTLIKENNKLVDNWSKLETKQIPVQTSSWTHKGRGPTILAFPEI